MLYFIFIFICNLYDNDNIIYTYNGTILYYKFNFNNAFLNDKKITLELFF